MPRMGSFQQIDLQQGTVHSLEVSWPEKKEFGGIQSAIDFICSPGQVAPDRGRHKSVDLSEAAQDGPLLFGRQHEWVRRVSIVKSKIIYSISPLAAVLLCSLC